MKIAYQDIVEHIDIKPPISEISEYLFQLGHEHEIENEIFDIEFTPNRGDCLSVKGLLRDLSLFYDVNFNREIFKEEIEDLSLNFKNKISIACPKISFLQVEIESDIAPYKSYLKDYFNNLSVNTNNFFTDISNYISYELGQPTHCYDASKIDGEISINLIDGNTSFKTLFDTEVQLKDKNLVFLMDKEIINLAGVIGGKSTSCSDKTRSVIIECAYFNPEYIIGKSVKYDIKSDAAHKFERGSDPMCHEMVLRRFLKIIEDHATIQKVRIFQEDYCELKKIFIPFDKKTINKIIGTQIDEYILNNYLSKLGFKIVNKTIEVPSYRSDIKTQNDIAEEIARSIGYDNILSNPIDIPLTNSSDLNKIEAALKNILIDNGFYEVINNPFVSNEDNLSLKVDNPLDSNKIFLRTNLRQSLIDNLMYNERRQKESIKLFEISNVYSTKNLNNKKRIIGIIASGKVGKNFIDFSKEINTDYMKFIFNNLVLNNIKFEDISRDSLKTRLKNRIMYIEIDLEDIDPKILNYKPLNKAAKDFTKYVPISDFPSSSRDLSFLIEDYSKVKILEKSMLNFKHELLKETFVFDYYKNDKMQQVKIAFRFIFQSNTRTITDKDVNEIMRDIISSSTKIPSISIPGIK